MKLGDLNAWRYRDLKPEGFDQSLTMYVVPTTEGVATVACAAPAAKAEAFLPDCEGAATSLVLTTGDAYPLGPDEDYLEALDNTIGQAQQRPRPAHPALRRARTGPGQARAAGSLRDSYNAAAKSLAGLEISPAIVPGQREPGEGTARDGRRLQHDGRWRAGQQPLAVQPRPAGGESG